MEFIILGVIVLLVVVPTIFIFLIPFSRGMGKASKSVTRGYNLNQEQVFNMALQAVRKLNYKIGSIDENGGLLQFYTGLSLSPTWGQDMSVLVSDNGNGTSTVVISGKAAYALQLTDWGEAKRAAKKVLAYMDKLQPTPSSTLNTVQI